MKNKLRLVILCVVAVVFSAGAVRGDVNGDQEVNIADVNAVIGYILNGDNNPSGDVNLDNEVNIADVNFIIAIILGGPVEEEITPKEIALDFSDLQEPAERIPEDEDASDYGDYAENSSWSTTVRITFDEETATVTGAPTTIIATIDGNTMTLVCMPYNLPPAVLDVSGTIAVETERPMVGEYCDAKCTVTNNGTDFNNYIYLLVDGELKEARLVDVDAGQTAEIPFRFYPPSESGTHTVSLAHNRKRIGNTYDFEYTILATCQIEVFKPIDGELKIAIESPDIVNGIISSDKIKVKLTFVNCLETDYDNKIKLEVMHRLSDGEEDHNYELWKTVDVSTPIPALGTVVKEVVVDGFVDGYYYINPYYKIDAYRWMFARQPDNYSYHYLSIDFHCHDKQYVEGIW